MFPFDCIIQEDTTTCYQSCKTCSPLSKCGDQYSCTSCFPDQYKISEAFDDTIFECSKTCDGFSYQLDDYWYCDKVDNITAMDIPGISKIQFEDSSPFLLSFDTLLIISVSFAGFACVCGCIGCYYYYYTIYYTRRSSRFIQPEYVEQALISTPKKSKNGQNGFNSKNSNNKNFKQTKNTGDGSYSRVYEETLHNEPAAIKVARKQGKKGTLIHTPYKLLKKSLNANYAAYASKASDVWSVWQIFKKTKIPKDIIAIHENGKKLPTPDLMPENSWRHNFHKVFDLDSLARRNMAELHKVLKTFPEETTISTV